MFSGKRAVAAALAGLGALFLVLGVSGLWVRRQVVDPDRFTSMGVDLLQSDAVRFGIAKAALDPLLKDAPAILTVQRTAIERVVASVLGDEPFVRVFARLLREVHDEAINGSSGPLLLDVNTVTKFVYDELPRVVAPELVDHIPPIADVANVAIVSQAKAAALRTTLSLARTGGIALAIAGLALIVAAVVAGGRIGLAVAGFSTLVVAGFLFTILYAAKAALLAGIADVASSQAASAAWDVITAGLVRTILIIGAAGGVIGVLTLVFAPRRAPAS